MDRKKVNREGASNPRPFWPGVAGGALHLAAVVIDKLCDLFDLFTSGS